MRVALLVWFALASSTTSEFDRCDREWREDRQGRAVAACVRAAADARGRWAEAAVWLQSALTRHPDSGWVRYQLAEVSARLRSTDAIALYVAAVDEFMARSNHAGEVDARVGLGVALYGAGRADAAWREAPRILAAANKSSNRDLIARALVYEAWLAHQTGDRLGRAMGALHEAESLVFPGGPYALQVRVLFGLGNISLELGRYDDALPYFSRAIDLARDNGDATMMALGSSNVLTTRRKQMESRPDPDRLPEFTDEARRLALLADAAQNPALQAIAHRALGDLLASTEHTRDEAGPHYELALSRARQSGDRNETATCLWAFGRFLADAHPARSRTLLDEALQMALQSGSATSVAYALRQQMRLGWKTRSRDDATVDSFRALDAIETLRALEGADVARASVFAAWNADYYWLIDRLLKGTPERDQLARAFDVSERMRARVLLDSLQRQRLPGAAPPKAGPRGELLRAISSVQRRLLDPELRGEERRAAVADLEQLERREAQLGAAQGEAGQSLTRPSDLASLDAIENSLAANEAMLSFSIGVGRNFYGEFAGGSWLLVTTTAGTQVVELPDRTALEPMLTVFRGIVESETAIDDRPAVVLYQSLLRTALETLPPTVTRLIVIPDGSLHHLPFAALRPAPTAPHVGSTYEVVVAPSATVWRWLTQRASPGRTGALVLADPVGFDTDRRNAVAIDRDWSFEALDLGRLPYSRREGRVVASHAGDRSRLLTGADATEAAVKTSGGSFAILHFATHAIVDDAHPERSALLLTDGGEGEDGLLQAREIAQLQLHDAVVVLSACRSGTGAVLSGEGVIGLSRSFFEAGARTVVGTLWAIRDDHAARFADYFYTSLRSGRSVGSALHEARRQAIDAGLPAATWSSYTVIGDDRIVPLARRVNQSMRQSTVLAVVVLLCLSTGLFVGHRARRAARNAGRDLK